MYLGILSSDAEISLTAAMTNSDSEQEISGMNDVWSSSVHNSEHLELSTEEL